MSIPASERAAAGQTLVEPTVFTAYRPDIDGLRALAVVPVILFHAGVRGFSGGYVGVEIFFVISGFLITSLLIKDVQTGKFGIAEFYRRRVLRIFPALFAMLLVVTLVASVSMLPSEMARYSRSLAAAAAFYSNIQFYIESDYFGLASAVKPLLHTWSLAVEEQWYIAWPLLIAIFARRRLRWVAAVAAIIVVISLAFCVQSTGEDMAAAFFLLPSRAWELALGALLASMAMPRLPAATLEILGLLGLVMILASIKVFTAATPFPGTAALLPCCGAFLIILSGRHPTRVSRLLSVLPLRFLGRISYSLYLWHWPVIVFAQLTLFLPRTASTIGLELGIAFILAWLSWKYVEQPFRHGGRTSARRVLKLACAAIAAALLLALATPLISARLMPLDPSDARMASYAELDGDGMYRRGICFSVGVNAKFDARRCLGSGTGRAGILFVGDSHAAALWPGLSKHAEAYDIYQATATGCVAKRYTRPERGYCERVINSALIDWLRDHRPVATLVASRWRLSNLDGLQETLLDPDVRAGHPVLIGPAPEYFAALPRLLVFAHRRDEPELVDRARDPDTESTEAALREIAVRTGTPYISLLDYLCPTHEKCRTQTESGAPLQFDYGHWTQEGSKYVIDEILRQLANVPK